MAAESVGVRPFIDLTNAELKHHAADLVLRLRDAPFENRRALLVEVQLVRDEMLHRLPPGGDDAAGVREPRTPRPGSGAGAVAIDEPTSDE